MANDTDDAIGFIISAIAYILYKVVPSGDVLLQVTKGELIIIGILVGVILIWSVCHAIAFIVGGAFGIARLLKQEVKVERIELLKRKLHEIYRVLVS